MASLTDISVRTDGNAVMLDITSNHRKSSITMTPQAATALALRLTDVACIARLMGDVRSCKASEG